MDIRPFLEARIKDAGLTKKEFAERMGAHAGSLNSLLEAPSWPTLERIASALDTNVQDLFAGAPHITCPHCGHQFPITVGKE